MSWKTFWRPLLSRANSYSPTGRAAGAAACAGLLVLVSEVWRLAGFFTLAAAVAWLIGVLLDAWSLPRRKDLTATRRVDRLEVGQSSAVYVTLSLDAAPGLAPGDGYRANVWDDCPPALRGRGEEQRGRVRPGLTHFSYQVTPDRRGDVAFKDIHARLTGPLGMLRRQYTISARTPQPVWPDLKPVPRKRAALQRALRLSGDAVHRMASGNAEFSHIRDYAAGDDPRSINWFATARRGGLMRNVYRPERGQHVILALDCGRTMAALQNEGKTRLDLALEALILTASAALERGDEVSVIAYSDKIHRHLRRLRGSARIADIVQSVYNLAALPVYAGPQVLADAVYAHHRRHSLLLLFSDLSDLAANDLFERHAHLIETRHSLAVMSFVDAALQGVFEREPKTLDDAVVVGVAAALLSDRTRFRERLLLRGITVVESREELFSAALEEYVRFKNAGRGWRTRRMGG